MSTDPLANEKLVFVYLGKKFPGYARKSIKFAKKYSGLDVVLVCEKKFIRTGLDDKHTYLLSNNYKKRLSQNLANSAHAKFRKGFWLKTTERFFALEEYMQSNQIKQCFHAELDNLIFANDGLANRLNTFGSGLFLPFDSQNRAIASIMYLNSTTTLRNFCQFVDQIDGNYNDMELLALYGAINPSGVFALPSSIENRILKSELLQKGIQTINENDIGIFDAAAIGQWYFGIDPRNSYFKIRNRFINDVAEVDLSEFQMRWSDKPFRFHASDKTKGRKEYLVNNLHIHSKIHRKITRPGALISIVNRTDSGYKIVISQNVLGMYRGLKFLTLSALAKVQKMSKAP